MTDTSTRDSTRPLPATKGARDGGRTVAARIGIGAFAAAMLLARQCAAADEVAVREQLQTEAAQLLEAGDIAGFDRRATELRISRERSPSGIWLLSLFYNGVERLPVDAPDAPLWARLEAATSRHLAAHPTSPAAIVVAARVLVTQAWARRGSGYGRTLDAKQRAGFAELLEQARVILDDHRAVGIADPQWYALRIGIMNWQGGAKAGIKDLAEEALAVEPTYQPTHYMASFAFLPKWGGSADMLDYYLAVAGYRSSPAEGSHLYGRVMFNIARWDPEPVAALKQVRVDWPRLWASLRDITRAYPDPWNLNVQRALACLVGTQREYAAAAARVGAERIPVAWFDTAFTWTDCEARQGLAATPPAATWLRALATTPPSGRFVATAAAAVLLALAILALARRTRVGEQPATGDPGRPRPGGSEFPREYPMSLLWKVGIVSVGALLALGAVGLAWQFGVLSADDRDTTASLVIVFVAVLVAAGCVIFALDTLASKIVLFADAIVIHELLRVRRIARADIAWRETLHPPSSPPVLALTFNDPGRRTLKLPMTWDADRDWTAWFAAIPDHAGQAARAFAAEVEANTGIGATPAERHAHVAGARRIARAAIWVNVGLVCWVLFYPQPLELLIPALVALPWVAVGLMLRSPGVYALSPQAGSTQPDLTITLIGPGLLLTTRSLMDIQTLEWQRSLALGAIISTALVAGVLHAAPAADRKRIVALILSLILLAPYGYGVCTYANAILDRSDATVYQARVLDKRVSRGSRSSTPKLTLGPWGPRTAPEEVTVSSDTYRHAVAGRSVCVELRPGALRIQWYEVVPCRAP